MVIFIHAASEGVSLYNKDSFIYLLVFVSWRFMLCTVPAFIFLSGLRFTYSYRSREFKYGKYVAKRFSKVYVPYLICFFIYYFYFLNHGYFSFNFKKLLTYIFYGSLVSHFYFVVTVMQFYLTSPLWLAMVKKFKFIYVFFISLGLTLFCRLCIPAIFPGIQYTDRFMLSYGVFWVMGCYAGFNYKKFTTWISQRILIRSLIFFIITVLYLSFFYLSSRGLIAFNYYYAETIHVLFCVIATLFLFMLSIWFSTLLKQDAWLRRISIKANELTYYVYLIHILFIFIVNDRLNTAGVISITKRYVIRLIFAYALSFGSSWLYSELKALLKAGKKPHVTRL